MLDTNIRLRAVRRDELRVGAKDRPRNPEKRSRRASASSYCEDCGCVDIHCDLLESVYSVLLDRAVKKRQRKPIIEKPKASAHNPFFKRTPRKTQPWVEVVLVGTKRRGHFFNDTATTEIQS